MSSGHRRRACDLLVHNALPGVSPGVRSTIERRECDLRQNKAGECEGQRYPGTKENPYYSDLAHVPAIGALGFLLGKEPFTEAIYLRVVGIFVSCRMEDFGTGLLAEKGCARAVENALKIDIIRLKRRHLGATYVV